MTTRKLKIPNVKTKDGVSFGVDLACKSFMNGFNKYFFGDETAICKALGGFYVFEL